MAVGAGNYLLPTLFFFTLIFPVALSIICIHPHMEGRTLHDLPREFWNDIFPTSSFCYSPNTSETDMTLRRILGISTGNMDCQCHPLDSPVDKAEFDVAACCGYDKNLERNCEISALASSGPLSFLTQIRADSFSFCLAESGPAERCTLTIGFDSKNRSSGEMFGKAGVVTARLAYSQLYPMFHYVEGVTGISVGGKMLDGVTEMDFAMERGGVVLDPGSSLTVLPVKVYQVLREALFIDKFMSQFPRRFFNYSRDVYSAENTCFELKNFDFSAKSLIEIHLGNQKLDFPWKNIFAHRKDLGEAVYCLMFEEKKTGVLTPSILGAHLLQNTLVTYNFKNSIVSFKKKQC